MTDIRELDARTVERIAAGEVVERPASVAKELVENALDAGATRVDVTVEAGGTDLVRVSDDGEGMARATVRRAIEQHTTSKLRDATDLETGVTTLGFRGEALHAIAAVSRLTITTRPPDAARGTELVVEGGDLVSVEPTGCPVGTTVTVADLFYNVPARRKYLAEPATEFGHVNRVVSGYALASPDVAVTLTHGDRETFATTGGGDRRAAVMSVYGREVATSMLPVETDRSEGAGPLDAVTGLVSHPETTRASREYLSTFVNGRYVTAGAVREAVVAAYGGQLASDRYPFAVLDLGLDPASVDVNVHPRKLEVRFVDEAGVREQVRTAVEESLLAEGLLRSGAPRGRSAPDQTPVEPVSRDEADRDDPSGRSPDPDPDPEPEPDRVTDSEPETGSVSQPETADATGRGDSSSGSSTEPESRTGGRSRPAAAGGGDATTGGDDPAARKFTAHEQRELPTDVSAGAEYERLPAMRVLGQLQDSYVVAETADGLVLVDQHAADERVNYERLRAAVTDVETQALAEPVELSLTAGEAAAFGAYREALARIGFRADRVDDRTVAVRTVPALLVDGTGPELLQDLLADRGTAAEPADTVDAAVEDVLADLACYPSVTGNTSLTEGSVVDLLDRLDGCENPWACPHGRPVVIELDHDEIAARFERDYPGHD